MTENPKLRKIVRLEVSDEYLASFPEGFLFHYEQLWHKGLGDGLKGRGGGENIELAPGRASGPRTSTSQVETRGGAKPGKKLAGASTRDVMGPRVHIEFKRRVDRKLREVNRMMRVWLADKDERTFVGRRCTVCKRFGDDGWLYCPNDGKPMEDVDRG